MKRSGNKIRKLRSGIEKYVNKMKNGRLTRLPPESGRQLVTTRMAQKGGKNDVEERVLVYAGKDGGGSAGASGSAGNGGGPQ